MKRVEKSLGRILLTGLFILAAGCTTIPEGKFAALREAFEATRTQSESVLADYAAARDENQQRKKPQSAETNRPVDQSLMGILNLSPYKTQPPKPAEDAVAVRLAAWDVLAKYNEALAAVAAGVKAEQVESSVNGFLTALKNFPIDEVASLGAEVAPYGKALAGVIELIEKEVRARKFKDAVLKAAPQLERFNQALQDDAEKFHAIRFALYTEDYENLKGDILDLRFRFRAIVDSHGWTNGINSEIDKVNKMADVAEGLNLYPKLPPAKTENPAAADRQAADLRDAETITAQMVEKREALRTTLRETKAYRALMDQYALLLRNFKQTQADLVEAVEKSSNHLPSTAQIEQVISSVRLAREIYTSTK